MKTYVAKNAPKNKTYYKDILLDVRFKMTAGIYMVGYHFFWTYVTTLLEMEIFPNFKVYLLWHNKRKLKYRVGEYLCTQHAMINKREQTKLHKVLDQRFKGFAKNWN